MYSRVKSNTANPPYYCAYDWLYYADLGIMGESEDILIRKHQSYKIYMTRVQKGYMVAPNDTWMGASDGYDKTSKSILLQQNGVRDML